MSKLFGVTMAVGLIAVMLTAWNVASVWAATPPEPTYGTADVDGNDSEWDLPNDFFANMYQGGDPNKDILSKLYLRYDCSTETLYALVLAEPGVTIEAFRSENHFIKLGIAGKPLVSDENDNDGTPPDFAWVGLSGPPETQTAQGWEASADLDPGTYNNLNVHTQVYEQIGDEHEDDQTSAVKDRAIDLEIDCTPASLGDYVWHDVNMNGLQDDGESGLEGVTVNLYDGSGNFLKDTTTSGDGSYLFDNLVPGDYQVGFVLPEDYNFSLQDQGSDDTDDSDADPTTGKTSIINLSPGETDLTWDAGMHLCAIGDRVWHDQDGNGDQNGTEPGFDNVKVYLYNSDPGTSCDGSGSLAMRTTGSGTSQTPEGYTDGIYIFDMEVLGLPPGEYWVCVDESTLPDPPAGKIWARTTGPHTTGDNPQKVTYEGNDIFSIDFGYTAVDPGSIGDYVWIDDDGGGDQDANEVGINGVVVELYEDEDCDGVIDAEDDRLQSTTTDNAPGTDKPGWYLFTALDAGCYIVKLADSNFQSGGTLYEYALTTQNATGVTDDLDSDFHVTEHTASVTLAAGEQNLTIDAGVEYTGPPTAVTLSSFAARSSAGGWASPLWLGFAGLTVLAAGFWAKRRSR